MDWSGNKSYSNAKPRKASDKGKTGGKSAKAKKSGSCGHKDPAKQY